MATGQTLENLVRSGLAVREHRERAAASTRRAIDVILDPELVIRSAEDVYAAVIYSPSTLKGHFRQDMGLPVARFIRRYRIVRSFNWMVERPHDPVGLIADRLGYSAPSAMIRTWRTELDITPGTARQALLRCGGRFYLDRAGLIRAAAVVDGFVRSSSGRPMRSLSKPNVVLPQQLVQGAAALAQAPGHLLGVRSP